MSNSSVGVLVVLVAVWLVCGMVAAVIAARKSRSAGGFFVLGFLFGPIGVLVAILAARGNPAAPKGSRSVTCPRCNAQQNISATQGQYECWQCKLVSPSAAR
ncbi:hypothetical protein ACH49M_03310 [Rhodococcus qingshengii]|uniref:hypothetical protein n=1 Tax=Rhodococcus TaxID=1827 RepID=UPI0013F672D0|nr:hypothetical protein [Rhodococcus qingshengii]NHE66878.1 hypothetical protein [Rhodococcus sp. D-46]